MYKKEPKDEGEKGKGTSFGNKSTGMSDVFFFFQFFFLLAVD